MTDGFSVEVTARGAASLRTAAPGIPPATPVAVTFLPGEDFAARLAAVSLVRDLGFEPMPHVSARRIVSATEFEDYLAAATEQAGVTRCFVIAGDPSKPEGPVHDSAALIAIGAFERCGIDAIASAGTPRAIRT